MANVLDDLQKTLALMRDRGAEFNAFEASLRELNTTLVSLLSRMEDDQEVQDTRLLSAFAALKFPAPQVLVHPTVGAKPGDTWTVKLTRTVDGATMVITKI